MSEENPSQHEANKVIRVLTGKQLKLTIRIHKLDGSIIEFQSDGPMKIDYNADARGLWLEQTLSGYVNQHVCPYEVGMIVLAEENPKP